MKISEITGSRVAKYNAVQAYLDAGRIPNMLILRGLTAEARKAGSFEQFQHDFLGQIKHGLYWHWTNNANFQIDLNLGPRDMSSMGDARMTPGELMITSDLPYWSNYGSGGKSRPYVAIIDMSDVPRQSYRQVNRGFGNEFIVTDPSRARVVKVVTPAQAYRIDRDQHKWLPQSHEQLARFYQLATGKPAITEVVVGNAGPETMMIKKPERERIPPRRVQRPPQPGYFVRLGNKLIPAPLDQSDNELGVLNSVVGG